MNNKEINNKIITERQTDTTIDNCLRFFLGKSLKPLKGL